MSAFAFGLAALLAGSGGLHDLRVTNGSQPFARDNQLLTTVSPNGDGFRDRAIVSFRLRRAATVRMERLRTGLAALLPPESPAAGLAKIAATLHRAAAGGVRVAYPASHLERSVTPGVRS